MERWAHPRAWRTPVTERNNVGMSDPFQNLQEKTGRSMPEWFEVLEKARLEQGGLDKHAEIMNWLKSEHGVSHGFANGIALQFRARGSEPTDIELVDAQYAAKKSALRPVYDLLIAAARGLGDDVEVVPKKTSVSLRRTKQFAVIEAMSATRIQLGLQLRDVPVTDRLLAWGGMCSHKVNLAVVADVDDELIGWLREAYERN
jgi:Domain of unknown function (DUF5655)/Domain of unknown function (DUF4287)